MPNNELKVPNLFTDFGALKNLYAPLVLIQLQPKQVSLSSKIFLTSYSEKYSARWNSEETYGALNRNWSYSGTGKVIDVLAPPH